MHIYVNKTTATESQLLTLGDELYRGAHADKGLTDFHYGFTQVGDNYDVNFEILGTDKQVAFIKMVDASFDIVRIEPAEDGEEEEKEAIDWWQKTKETGGGTISEFDRLVAELVGIGRIEAGYGRFNRADTRVREIGAKLDEMGGMDLMLTAHNKIKVRLGAGAARKLEDTWGYIGKWLP